MNKKLRVTPFHVIHEWFGSKNNFQETIAHIALGREVNRLEERINGFSKRFEERLADLHNEEERFSSELQDKNARIQQITNEKKDPEAYKNPVCQFIVLVWPIKISLNEVTISNGAISGLSFFSNSHRNASFHNPLSQ